MSTPNHHFLSFLFLIAMIVGCGGLATAQTVTGTLQGTVTDSNGAVVSGANVVIRNVETGQERTLSTTDDGLYSAPFLPIGRYSVVISASGFTSVTQENVEVGLNQTRVINIVLNPSTVTEAVQIVADAAPINTTNAEIKGSLNSQEILDKPTFNQSNFLTLAETFTGFQENPTSGQNNPTASSGSSINFNGTGTRGATFQINGVNNDDSSENQNRQGASLSTIKEFQVITNNFTAEFGRGYGAVVLVQTKSGTNNFHGDVYWYHNSSALNATANIFTPGLKKPVNRRNQYGFTSGFPISKNRLFGFINFDEVRNSGAGGYTRDVFLAKERNPANWFLQTPSNDTPENRAFIQSVIDRFPPDLVPNDPRSIRTFVGAVGFDRPLKDYSGRLDWNPRDADQVVGRWQYTRQVFDNEDIIIGETTKQNNKQQNIGITWTHLFSDRTVGEFRYGLGLRTTLVGIKGGNDTPIIRFAGTPVAGSIIGNAGQFPINRWQTDHQVVYNVSTLIGGNHFLKAGTDIRRQRLDDVADNNSRGFWNFSATCNGVTYRDPNTISATNPLGVTSPYYAFLNGCINAFTKGYGPFFLENRINESNVYVEDNWKIRPNLTLNLGARYEYVAAPEEAAGRVDYGFGADKNNIEPRLGFAWSPDFESGFLRSFFGGVGDSSIRGGYGIYHGRIFQSVFSQSGATVRFNPPNAILLAGSGAPTARFDPTNLTDPTNGFVFIPGPQTTRTGITKIDPGLEMPYTQQWNLSFERQLPFTSSLRISYTGNRGIGLLRYALDNLPLHDSSGVLVPNHPNNAPAVLYTAANRGPGDPRAFDVRGQVIRPAADIACAGTGLPNVPTTSSCLVPVPLGNLEYSLRVPRTNERRPDGVFTTNLTVANASWSYYHGLQLEWVKRLSNNFNFQAAYTFSKALDTTSEATFVGAGDSNQTGNNARAVRGPSRFHTPHRFTLYGTYRTPWFSNDRGFLGQTLGGWQFSAVVKLAKGTPFTVTTTGLDLNLDGFSETRPVLLDPSVLGRSISNPSTSTTDLPRTAFRTLATTDFNTAILGRNTFFGDGVRTVDFGLQKNFPLPWESHRLLLRADLFNAFNHVQYGFPTTDITSANFGRILGTHSLYSPRVIQFALRYQY
ncbi:MAG TPA: carboxypeptidase regulatory-like domain-containing protein [Pyrinomonadaceae bacterium]|nr:carboxypeptidase regulatory-like domain-containing protein [Pyrinomonadaceae bacterium]